MTVPGPTITLTDSPDCIQALCDRTNTTVGSHLRYRGRYADGRFMVTTVNNTVVLLGDAVRMLDLVTAFECGYLAAQHDAAKPSCPIEARKKIIPREGDTSCP